ncbi:MAG: type II secretion system F family protein [Bryobacteraceae bacterium]
MVVGSILLFFAITFVTIALAVVAGSIVFQKLSSSRAGEPPSDAAAADEDFESPLFKAETLSTISLWHSLLTRFDFVENMKARMAEADLSWSVGRLTSMMLLAGTLALVVATNLEGIPAWAAVLAGGVAAAAPYLYVLRRRRKRFERFREFFPDALDSLARALRAGYPLSASLDVVAAETPDPVSVEMRKTFVEANLGLPWDRALSNLATRVPLLEVNLFAAAVQLHSRTGGRLNEVIAGLSETMRENVALQGEVRSMAAHGKLTGLVLTLIPLAIMAMMAYVSPMYVRVLLDYKYGKDLIAIAIACLVAAHFVIRRIVDIEI